MSDAQVTNFETPPPACCKCAAYREIILAQGSVIAEQKESAQSVTVHMHAIQRNMKKIMGEK